MNQVHPAHDAILGALFQEQIPLQENGDKVIAYLPDGLDPEDYLRIGNEAIQAGYYIRYVEQERNGFGTAIHLEQIRGSYLERRVVNRYADRKGMVPKDEVEDNE